MDLGLRGKHAIVTGGSLGIGKAIALELAREGVDVAIVARTKDQLEATARELSAETGRRIIPLAADVTSKAQVDAMVAQAAAQLGGLHILVNSGSPPGGSPGATGPIESIVDEDLLHDFDVKYVGALRCARAAIPYLKEQRWGRIINISGTNARNAGNLSGGARNTSLVHLTKTLAVQVGRFGITVNCVHPGIDAHRAHAAAPGRPGQGAGHRRRRGRGARLRPRLAAGQRHLPDGGRRRDRLRHGLPGLGQGVGRQRRARGRHRRCRAAPCITSRAWPLRRGRSLRLVARCRRRRRRRRRPCRCG